MPNIKMQKMVTKGTGYFKGICPLLILSVGRLAEPASWLIHDRWYWWQHEAFELIIG
jgi:hypothetical protein